MTTVVRLVVSCDVGSGVDALEVRALVVVELSHGNDLLLEPPLVLSRHGALVRAERPGVLVLP